ncbi:MAG: hypothetical protein VB048_11895, partial [Bacteroidaceae bacterium]|nr:hypothetical protein [Bacteroidaceae bacterium]
PMLETIREMLKGESKILLTSRRSAIFSDDAFFEWLNGDSEFKFFRYNISEPDISDWISVAREKLLKKAGLNLKSISNPVLLAYLRSMDDDQFNKALTNIDQIIESYIIKLMNRENERQELNMSIEEQTTILCTISSYFTDHDITSESKDIIEKLIIEKEQGLIVNVINRFVADKRPTIDQLINKLIIHAFLDRKGDSGNQIGFVNDFILGSFVGNNLVSEEESWIGTERFIDFVLTSYIPRNKDTKEKIYRILKRDLINYLDIEKQVFIDIYLFGKLNRDLTSEFLTNLEFREYIDNDVKIEECTFSECDFYKIDFSQQLSNSHTLYFINCSFFDCNITESDIHEKNLNFTNCHFSPENENIVTQYQRPEVVDIEEGINYEKKVLERFWQSGKDKFIPFKRPTTLRLGIPPEEVSFIDEAIDELIKKDYIIKRRGQHSLQLNIKYLSEIKNILGR